MMEKSNKKSLEILIRDSPPNSIEKYRDTYVLANSEKSFYDIFSGETRNTIRNFFSSKKKLMGKCQFRGCSKKNVLLDTVHFTENRPRIFMTCARKFRNKSRNQLFKYEVYGTMECFLYSHRQKRSVCFLCKAHHNRFHDAERQSMSSLKKFKSKILWQ